MDHWTNGPMDQWTNKATNQGTIGSMDQWTKDNGLMDKWTHGHMDNWTNGQETLATLLYQNRRLFIPRKFSMYKILCYRFVLFWGPFGSIKFTFQEFVLKK